MHDALIFKVVGNAPKGGTTRGAHAGGTRWARVGRAGSGLGCMQGPRQGAGELARAAPNGDLHDTLTKEGSSKAVREAQRTQDPLVKAYIYIYIYPKS